MASKQFVIVKDHSKGNAWSEHWVILDHKTESYYLSDPTDPKSYVHDKDWTVTYAKSSALNLAAKQLAEQARTTAKLELAKVQAQQDSTPEPAAEAPKPQAPKAPRKVAAKVTA